MPVPAQSSEKCLPSSPMSSSNAILLLFLHGTGHCPTLHRELPSWLAAVSCPRSYLSHRTTNMSSLAKWRRPQEHATGKQRMPLAAQETAQAVPRQPASQTISIRRRSHHHSRPRCLPRDRWSDCTNAIDDLRFSLRAETLAECEDSFDCRIPLQIDQ